MEQTFKAITEIIKNCDNVILMTHKNPDFDGMGAAIAMQQIIHSFHKESYIVLNRQEKDKSLLKSYQFLKENGIYFQALYKNEIESKIQKKTALIILDTSKESLVEDNKLLSKIHDIVIIDHHIRNKDYIKNSILSYNNTMLSSTIEFMVEYLKFLNITIPPFIATIMLVGLEIDTNSFKLKVTDKTYEAAAFLVRMGADNILKQELVQETKKEYLKRQRLVEKSYMIQKNMAMCVADADKIYEPKELATTADELLQFENVEASFVIGRVNKEYIGISARSLGNINVEKIMEQLGGGGHVDSAASKIKGELLEVVEKQLIEVIGGQK